MNLDKKQALHNIDVFVENFVMGQKTHQYFNYGPVQKKILKASLVYFLNGGNPMGQSSAKCGSLTNDEVGSLAAYKNDSGIIGNDSSFNQTILKACKEFGQVPSKELYRGIGAYQTKLIRDKITAGQTAFTLNKVQSFTDSLHIAEQFAKNGGGSMTTDNSHGSGDIIVLGRINMPLFYLDEFQYYSILAERMWREISSINDIQTFLSEFDSDENLEYVILENEWLVPTTYIFKFQEFYDEYMFFII